MITCCARCGAEAEPAGMADGPALPSGGSLATDERGVSWLCDVCTRTHVRAIEAKLDEAWW